MARNNGNNMDGRGVAKPRPPTPLNSHPHHHHRPKEDKTIVPMEEPSYVQTTERQQLENMHTNTDLQLPSCPRPVGRQNPQNYRMEARAQNPAKRGTKIYTNPRIESISPLISVEDKDTQRNITCNFTTQVRLVASTRQEA